MNTWHFIMRRSAHKAALRQGEKRVLILGAGYVARPAIEYLSRDENTIVTIGLFNISLVFETWVLLNV